MGSMYPDDEETKITIISCWIHRKNI